MNSKRQKSPKPQIHRLDPQQFAQLLSAINNLSANVAKWLAAIAIAAANPADNTEEVQKRIDEISTGLNAAAAAEEDALKQANQPKEN